MRFRWAELFLAAIAEISLRDQAFRRGLPVGFAKPTFDRQEARSTFRELINRFAAQASFDASFDNYVDQVIASTMPSTEGQLTQIERLRTLSEEDVVSTKPNLTYRVRKEGDVLRLAFGQTEIVFPHHVETALRFAIETGRFIVRELPGGLDSNGKITLVGRLLREGLLRIE
jgi:hypothetical protein